MKSIHKAGIDHGPHQDPDPDPEIRNQALDLLTAIAALVESLMTIGQEEEKGVEAEVARGVEIKIETGVEKEKEADIVEVEVVIEFITKKSGKEAEAQV